jgi:hypothetical protein
MKAALIPPIPLLHIYGHGDFHLLLSHLMSDARYFNHYADQRKKGSYLVLDNSAHEFRKGETAGSLREQAVSIRAQEVVVPDVLFDAAGTVESATCALETWFETTDSQMARLNPALMYVPQAHNQTEWTTCLMDLVSMHKYIVQRRDIRSDFVIGISKDYETWPDGIPGLLRIAHEVVRSHKAKVHLLGWGRKLWDLGVLAREYSWVRSTDSAKPFVYAAKGITLEPWKEIPKYPGRSGNYFNSSFQSFRRLVANQNVDVFRDLAEGKL